MLSMLTSAPTLEPVSLNEIRDDLRLETGEDLLLSTLITSARLVIEAQTGCRLITQNWDLLFDDWPDETVEAGCLTLPHYPIKLLKGIYLLGNARQEVSSEIYQSELGIRTPKVFLKNGNSWPLPFRKKLGVLISVTAGFGDQANDVPEPLRLAIRQLVSFWYDQADWNVLRHSHLIPDSVKILMQPYRNMHL